MEKRTGRRLRGNVRMVAAEGERGGQGKEREGGKRKGGGARTR